MEIAVILLIGAAVASGVTSAIVTSWSLRARTYSLEDRMAIVEGTINREVKIRAATERFKSPRREDAVIEAALLNPPTPQYTGPWWNNPNLKKGAYVP